MEVHGVNLPPHAYEISAGHGNGLYRYGSCGPQKRFCLGIDAYMVKCRCFAERSTMPELQNHPSSSASVQFPEHPCQMHNNVHGPIPSASMPQTTITSMVAMVDRTQFPEHPCPKHNNVICPVNLAHSGKARNKLPVALGLSSDSNYSTGWVANECPPYTAYHDVELG